MKRQYDSRIMTILITRHSAFPATLKARLLEYILEIATAEVSARDRNGGSDDDASIAATFGSTVIASQTSVASAPQPRSIPSQSQEGMSRMYSNGSTTSSTRAVFPSQTSVASAPQPRSIPSQSQEGMSRMYSNGSTTSSTRAVFPSQSSLTPAPQPRSIHAESQKGMWQWLGNERVRI